MSFNISLFYLEFLKLLAIMANDTISDSVSLFDDTEFLQCVNEIQILKVYGEKQKADFYERFVQFFIFILIWSNIHYFFWLHSVVVKRSTDWSMTILLLYGSYLCFCKIVLMMVNNLVGNENGIWVSHQEVAFPYLSKWESQQRCYG